MSEIQQAPSPAVFRLKQGEREFDYVVTPPDWEGEIVKDPDHEHTPPIVSGLKQFADTASFKAYFDRFSDSRTLVTASRAQKTVTAHLDYHLNSTTPSPAKHSVVRAFKPDRHFYAWRERDGTSFSQVKFAEFLEDRMEDIKVPTHAELLRSIVQFKAFRQSNCNSVIEGNGDVRFEFTQETRSPSGGVVLPERIVLEVPVLEFERKWEISARLRYELNEGKVTFKYELIEIADVVDFAFRKAVEDLSKVIGASILLED